MRFRPWFFVILLLCIYVAADSTTCSATKKCAQGCCNKSGNCGFGPDYCGKSVCRSDCDRKSECNPGFGSSWAKSDKCPLNVCCSKHGYCGTTKDFCGSKTVKRPSCKKDGEMERVVGYFESWAKDRPCEVFTAEQIPNGLYTHINFAFGTINPNTFQLEANSPEDKLAYQRLMFLKKRDKNLKIFLAVGGWTFNDPGRTAHIFSELAASSEKQNSFQNSVQSFMATYDFDGLDLDWEYPVDDKRGGRERDYINFPKFMTKLKKMMTTGDKGLTITLPASYWYLQYFDIKKLEPTVDFFNIMSYDLHGAWDQNVNWTKPYLNAHTNLTEVDSALDLLWRNDISPSKVVMGLGFYGRAFTMLSGSCNQPGCMFDGPANMGSCSREKGILLISEINNEVKTRKLKPKLYKEEAVKVVTWGKQWVSYDDEETLQLKVDRAGERCLGGVMVWAISHDTKDAKYNKALAGILGRELYDGTIGDHEKPREEVKKPYEQCRWSNCKESCPKGWVHVGRLDKGADDGELMYDETGCGGDGQHNFCCPPEEDIPQCGWYNHGNGACQKSTSCPSDMVEIGSNQMYCEHKPMVQTACCTTKSNSMKVYGQCTWGTYPECDSKPLCPSGYHDTPVASSGSGSGGLQCNHAKTGVGLELRSWQMRNYCCGTDPDLQFTDCQMFRNLGPLIKDHEDACRSNCPSDRVRVAIDWAVEACDIHPVGGQAWCCKTTYAETAWEPNEKLAVYKELLNEWIVDPYCPNPSKVFEKRHVSSSSTELALRANQPESMAPDAMLSKILGRVGSGLMISELSKMWDDVVREHYEWLQITYISRYIRDNWLLDWEGPAAFAVAILCSPVYWAQEIKAFLLGNDGSDSVILNCTKPSPCYPDGNCLVEDDDNDTADNERRNVNLFGRHSNHFSHSSHHHHLSRRVLEPRKEKDLVLKGKGKNEKHRFQVEVPPYDQPDKLDSDNPLLNRVVMIRYRDRCGKIAVVLKKHSDLIKGVDKVHVEHVLDKNIFENFMISSALGMLPSGVESTYGPIPIQFWERMEFLDLSLVPGAPKLPGNGPQHERLFERAYECLGSRNNDKVFMIVDQDINDAKNFIFRFQMKPNQDSVRDYFDRSGKNDQKIKDDYEVVLSRLRAAFSAFEYINMDESKTRLNKIIKDIYVQFKFAEKVYNEKYPDDKVQLANYWIEWITNHYAHVVRRFKDNVAGVFRLIADLTGEEGRVDDPLIIQIVPSLVDLMEKRNDREWMRIDTSGFPAIDSPVTGDEDGDEEMGDGDGDEEMGGT